MATQDELKQKAAFKAVEFVESGMVVGLGSGSTTEFAVGRIVDRLKSGDLNNIVGIASSIRTEKVAQELGIVLVGFDEYQEIDVTIDGADEVDPELNLIKGGEKFFFSVAGKWYYFNRKRPFCAQFRNKFIFVYNNNVPSAGLSQDFFPQKGSSSAFDQVQFRIDFISPINGDVNLLVIIKNDQRNTQFLSHFLGSNRTGYTDNIS